MNSHSEETTSQNFETSRQPPRFTLNFRKWDRGKWRQDKVAYTFHKYREFEGTISRITIKRDACGDYWLYLITDFVETNPLPTTGQSVGANNVIQGMDLVYSQTKSGMKDAYLTLSTGEKKTAPATAQRALHNLETWLSGRTLSNALLAEYITNLPKKGKTPRRSGKPLLLSNGNSNINRKKRPPFLSHTQHWQVSVAKVKTEDVVKLRGSSRGAIARFNDGKSR